MGKRVWLFVLYLVLGIFLLNSAFKSLDFSFLGFIPIPDFLNGITDWIVLVGSVLLIFESFKFLRKTRSQHEK